ncbi:MAG TPA: hypothetical protein VIM30_00355 [Candidatus Limnocylindrales bacterium]|jgi:hypothetical protein
MSCVAQSIRAWIRADRQVETKNAGDLAGIDNRKTRYSRPLDSADTEPGHVGGLGNDLLTQSEAHSLLDELIADQLERPFSAARPSIE